MNNKDDENLEKMIFEFCKNDKEVPPYVDKAVEDGLERCRNLPAKKSKFYVFKRVAIILICFGLLATGGVFAINYIVSLFTNSTPGIDSAVENGFVHDIDMDFVYDNNIGIKVDSVVMSSTTLDISFVYDCSDYDDVSKINIYEYEITDEDGNLIAKVNGPDIDENSLINEIVSYQESKLNSDYYYDSILLKGTNFLESDKLNIYITKILINYNNDSYYIDGKWIIDMELSDDLTSETENILISNDSEYIKSIKTYLNETTFIVEIELTESVDNYTIYDMDNVILNDENGSTYDYNIIRVLENKIYMEFNYGKYTIESELNLYIKFAQDKSLNIALN